MGSGSTIISGFRAYLVRIFLVANVLYLVLLSVKNPVNAVRILREVRKKRRTVQSHRKGRGYVRSGRRYFFSENVPGWPSAAFNSFIRAEIGRAAGGEKHPLSTVILAITSKCRLGCRHCYEWKNISSTDTLTAGNLHDIVTKLKTYGVSHIQLSGGEPLERFDDLIDLISFSSHATDIWLLTSGFGLTAEKAAILRKAGLTGADISLDHWDEKEHNLSRNNPESFYWVKEAVSNCRNAGILTTVSLCAFREFVSQENLMRYADTARSLGAGFIRILEPRRTGRFRGDIELGSGQIVLLEKFFNELNSPGRDSGYPLVTYPGYAQRRTGCSGAGNRYLYIDSVGEIHACPFCRGSAGNAIVDDLGEVIGLLRKKGCQKFELNLTE